MANKKRRCTHCKDYFSASEMVITPNNSAFCSIKHAQEHGQAKASRARERDLAKAKRMHQQEQKAVRAQNRKRKEALKTKSDWNKEAQAAFNKYIRVRDAGKPCIACGVISQQKYGGTVDASHYRSRGSSPHLRFHLLNCFSGCTRCNRYLSGNITEYRKGLIDRIGLARVEELECDNRIVRMDIEYLKRVKSIFNKRARLYEKLRKEKL